MSNAYRAEATATLTPAGAELLRGKRHLPVLTNSSITTFRRCAREYHFRYVLNRKARRKSAALKFGSLFHVGLNTWWQTILNNQEAPVIRLRCAIEMMRSYVNDDGKATDPFELVKAETLMAGYTTRWGDEPYETIAVEKQFRLLILLGTDVVQGDKIIARTAPGHAFDLGGSIDAIVQLGLHPIDANVPTTLHNVEHKTTSADISAGSDYWRHVIALDSQVSTYEAAAKAMGFDVQDTIYDVIRKPELVPLKATPEESKKYTKPTKAEPIPRLYANQRETDETPEEYRTRLTEDIVARPDWYFARQTIVRLDRDNEEHARDVEQTAALIRFSTDHDAWPRSPNACERYRRMCDFFSVCSGECSIDDGTRYEHKTRQHEELSE